MAGVTPQAPGAAGEVPRHEGRFIISADHPALPGHFPGRPLVPGVVVLDAVAVQAREAFALGAMRGVRRAKFAAPVLPGEAVRVVLSLRAPGLVGFACHVGDRVVATGEMAFAP